MHYNFTSNLWIEVSYTLLSVINYLNIYICFSPVPTMKQFESVFVLNLSRFADWSSKRKYSCYLSKYYSLIFVVMYDSETSIAFELK